MRDAGHRVELTADEAACVDPGGRRHAVGWSELRSVRVAAAGDGTSSPDLFWVLEGGGARCVVPFDAADEPALRERLLRLPGFDEGALEAAERSAGDGASFTCWRREDAAAASITRRRGRLTGAEKLALATALFGLLHHADHVLRHDHSGWPFRPEVTPFTWSLLVYVVIALLLALRRWPKTRVVLALVLFLVPTLAHVFLETPFDQYRTWTEAAEVNLLHAASPALGAAAVAVSVLLSVLSFATLIAFWRGGRGGPGAARARRL